MVKKIIKKNYYGPITNQFYKEINSIHGGLMSIQKLDVLVH